MVGVSEPGGEGEQRAAHWEQHEITAHWALIHGPLATISNMLPHTDSTFCLSHKHTLAAPDARTGKHTHTR